MRVLLVSANTEEINMLTLPLGLGMVAAAAREAGHEVEFLDLLQAADAQASVAAAVRGFSPEVIGVSVRNVDDQNMAGPRLLLDQARATVAACRAASDAPIVLGGAGYSLFPEKILAALGADMGIQGEGEAAFPMLLECLGRGAPLAGVPGLCLPGGGMQGARRFERDLDRFPSPAAYFKAPARCPGVSHWMPVQTRRGCPMDCSYCSTATIEGRTVRRRSGRSVVRDIARLAENGFDHFYFIDSTFNIPASQAREVCEAIIESGLKISWRCILYPARIDPRLADLMAAAGCREVSLGFESGCDRILAWYRKRFTSEDVRRTNRLFAERGIRCMGFLLIGAPGETRESVAESLVFADELRLDMLKITAGIRIYPGTRLHQVAVARGAVSPSDDLLPPRFYLAAGLGDWLRPTLAEWMATRPHWVF